MEVVLFCGGHGTRMREQTEFIPKPLVPIGGIPLIVHIMKHYEKFGFKDFILAAGYKQEKIKEYFLHRRYYESDIKVPYIMTYDQVSDWNVIISNTGENTLKGGRLARVKKYLTGTTFMCTYGDSLSDVNIHDLIAFHKSHGKIATVTGVHPPPRFGEIHHDNGRVIKFSEKPLNGDVLINGGYMVFELGIFNYLTEDESCDLEIGALEKVAEDGQLQVFHHTGYWSAIDTIVDMNKINELWNTGRAPWR